MVKSLSLSSPPPPSNPGLTSMSGTAPTPTETECLAAIAMPGRRPTISNRVKPAR